MKELKNFVKTKVSIALAYFVSFESLASMSTSQVASNPRLNSPTDGALVPMLLALMAIIVLIYSLAWLAKKFNITPSHQQHLKTITSMSLGGRERIVVVEIQGQQYALGVTPQSVNTLFKLDEPLANTSMISNDNKLLNKLADMLNNKSIDGSNVDSSRANKKG